MVTTSTIAVDSSLTPTITNVSPARGGTAGGTWVTITGSGYGTDSNAVKGIFHLQKIFPIKLNF